MSQRDFATSGRPVCKNSLFLKIRPLHHSEKRQLNQISVKSHHCYRNDQRYERKAEIQHLNTIRMRMTAFTAKPDMKPGLFKTKLSVYRANCP